MTSPSGTATAQSSVWVMPPLNVAVIPTGSLAIDLALGVGGIPRGRVTDYGPEFRQDNPVPARYRRAQAMGGVCAFVDMEHALDPIYAERLGVDG